MPQWDDLRFLLALSQHKTMSAAADALATNTATVSRRLERLAEAWGTSLMHRTGGSWAFSDTGQRLVDIAQDMQANLERERSNLSGQTGTLEATIRIAAPPAIIAHFLLPNTPSLHNVAPGIRLNFINRVYGEGLGDADVFLHMKRPTQGRIQARRVGNLEVGVFAKDGNRDPSQPWIGLTDAFEASLSMQIAQSLFDTEPTLRFATFPQIVEAMKITGFAGPTPLMTIADVPGFSELTKPDQRQTVEIWMGYHQGRRSDLALQTVINWISANFDAYYALP